MIWMTLVSLELMVSASELVRLRAVPAESVAYTVSDVTGDVVLSEVVPEIIVRGEEMVMNSVSGFQPGAETMTLAVPGALPLTVKYW